MTLKSKCCATTTVVATATAAAIAVTIAIATATATYLPTHPPISLPSPCFCDSTNPGPLSLRRASLDSLESTALSRAGKRLICAAQHCSRQGPTPRRDPRTQKNRPSKPRGLSGWGWRHAAENRGFTDRTEARRRPRHSAGESQNRTLQSQKR